MRAGCRSLNLSNTVAVTVLKPGGRTASLRQMKAASGIE